MVGQDFSVRIFVGFEMLLLINSIFEYELIDMG